MAFHCGTGIAVCLSFLLWTFIPVDVRWKVSAVLVLAAAVNAAVYPRLERQYRAELTTKSVATAATQQLLLSPPAAVPPRTSPPEPAAVATADPRQPMVGTAQPPPSTIKRGSLDVGIEVELNSPRPGIARPSANLILKNSPDASFEYRANLIKLHFS